MGITQFDKINSTTSRAVVGAAVPTDPAVYYGNTSPEAIDTIEWKGGELYFLSTTSKLYVQTATSGQSATWRYLNDAFATTSSTSTSTSSSTTTSTTTSTSTSTSSSTSTSTSTSSTTTS